MTYHNNRKEFDNSICQEYNLIVHMHIKITVREGFYAERYEVPANMCRIRA